MTRECVRIRYLPAGIDVVGHIGDTLLDAALEHGLNIQHECGGNCACTTCQVHVEQGGEQLSAVEEVEQDRLSTADVLVPHSRLACQAILIRTRGAEALVVTVVETLE